MKRKYEIIGAPFGFAANKNGSKDAPTHLRVNGLNSLIRMRENEFWNVDIIDSGDIQIDAEINSSYEENNILNAVKLFSNKIEKKVLNSYKNEYTPIIIGGDHSISIGTLSASSKYLNSKKENAKFGVIWVDAHTDLNSLESGNLHGKSLAISLGYVHQSNMKKFDISSTLNTSDINYIAIRDLMPNEYTRIKEHNIPLYGVEEIDEYGINKIIEKVISELEENTDGFFVSFDIDACDGALYKGCATPEIGGLTAREGLTIIKKSIESPKFMGIDLVEFSPEDDSNGNTNSLILKLIDAIFGFRK